MCLTTVVICVLETLYKEERTSKGLQSLQDYLFLIQTDYSSSLLSCLSRNRKEEIFLLVGFWNQAASV